MDTFFDLGIKDLIDIILVAVMLFYVYRMMRESRSLNIFYGILVFVAIWVLVSLVLEMRLLGGIMDKLVSVGVIGLVILFQEEIRRFLYNVGTQDRMRRLLALFAINRHGKGEKNDNSAVVMPIVRACVSMSRQKVGALIVIECNDPLDDIVATGELIDARPSQRLIENIFFKNSPLHDGAMVIADGRIKASGCILPVSHDNDIPRELGLRHRAAMGMSQESDALIVVVSEETGRITVAKKGEFQLRLSPEQLESILSSEIK